MRAALATTVLVLVGLIWFYADRLPPNLAETPPGNHDPADVAAPPPDEFAVSGEAGSPPPVPEMPEPRYSTAAEIDADAEPRLHVVREGDTLWSIAEEHYQDGHRARAIYEANRDQIGDPANLRTGQELIIP